MSKFKINIAVLITCHNRREKTIKCLEHLFANDLDLLENQLKVFLVDDGSNDGTSDSVKALFPQVNIIKGDGALYWNRGMNLAWREASKMNFDYYMWLNDDTYLFENSIKTLMESSIETNNQAIIVGTTIDNSNKLFTYGGRTEKGELIVPNKTLQECHHFNGNLVLIPGKVFKQIGFLDPLFHHAFGDFDYGLRAKKEGVMILIAPILIGKCEKNDSIGVYFDPEINIIKRINTLYKSSCRVNPFQLFIFEKRHKGLLKAIFHFSTTNLRALLPSFFK